MDPSNGKNSQLNVLDDVVVFSLEVEENERGNYARVSTQRTTGKTDLSYINNLDAFPGLLACLTARFMTKNLKLGVSIETATNSMEQTILELRYPSSDARLITKVAVPSLEDGYYAEIFTQDKPNGCKISHLEDLGNIDLTYAAIIGCMENLPVENTLDDPVLRLSFKKKASSQGADRQPSASQADSVLEPPVPSSAEPRQIPPAPGIDEGIPTYIRVPALNSTTEVLVHINDTKYNLSSQPAVAIGMTILLQFAVIYRKSVTVGYIDTSPRRLRYVKLEN